MQALPRNHLTVRLVRLRPDEKWTDDVRALMFILLKGGKGKYASKQTAWNLQSGDVMVLNPDTAGKLVVQNGELIFWYFSVCLEHLLPLFSAGEICLLQNIAENFKESKLYAAAGGVAQECHRLMESAPPQGNLEHRSQMLRIAAAVLSAEFQSARSTRSGFIRVEDHMLQSV